jgi:alpha-galactosidase
MPPIGRRTVLKLVTGSVAAAAVPWVGLPFAQAATRLPASAGKAVAQDGLLAVAFDGNLRTRLARGGVFATRWQASESLLLAEGELDEFAFAGQSTEAVSDPRHGPGQRTVVSGRAANGVEKQVAVTFYPAYPGLALLQTTYRNGGNAPLDVRGWRNASHELEQRPGGFWSFSGATHTDRRDWVQPLDDGFEQRNTLAMESSDYGGGTPVANIWRRDLGLAVGHVEPVPRGLDLPVRRTRGGAAIAIQGATQASLAPGDSLASERTFVCLHTGDHFAPLELYRRFMEAEGVVAPQVPASAFAPIWCAWGYERDFTTAQVLQTLPKVREMGFEWAVLDDGWQTNEGDWAIDRRKFPRGDADMRAFVAAVKAQGLRPRLWLAPLAADPGSDVLHDHPDMLLLDQDGSFQKVTWWNALTQCPAYQPVIDYHVALVKKAIGDWGFEGVKLDGQHLNAVAPCHNPAHNHARPEESSEKLPDFWMAIHNAAREANPEAVVELCPCGAAFAFHNLPATDQYPSSDPLSSWQVRHKGKTAKAMMGMRSSYAGDHVELSDNGDDWASSVGIGAVVSTKFTWPRDTDRPTVPQPPGGFVLTPEKEAVWRKWVDLYREHMLPQGEYLGALYDIGFDRPEAHAIRKDGAMYYTFYADDWSGPLPLRGLGEGRWRVRDLYNGTDLGVVDARDATVKAGFRRFLFLQATQEGAA